MRLFESERSGKLFQKVLELAGLFYSAGGRALLVGGAVRDTLQGWCVKDFDLEIHDLSADRVLELLQNVCEVDAVGMSFGVIKVKHWELDISLPRRENKVGRGHRGFLVEVDPALDFSEAAARRDFTVNAIMYDPLRNELIDPHGGVSDLKKGILRHVSSHFSEDPLRVLRGMQFVSRMGFEAAPETLELCAGISQEELPFERIGTEWEKMLLQGRYISKGLAFLKDCGWIRFYPELSALSAAEWKKNCSFLDKCASERFNDRQKDLVLMTGALVSALPVEVRKKFCRRLWNRNEMIEKAVTLAEAFRETVEMPETALTKAKIRRLSFQLNGTEVLNALLKASGYEKKEKFIKDVSEKEGILEKAPVPLISGKHGIGLGAAPGKELGTAVKACFEAQLDGLFSDIEEGKRYLEQLLKK